MNMHTEYTHTVSIRCTHSNVPHDWPHPRDGSPCGENKGKKSGGHRMMSAKQTLKTFLCGLSGDEELVRERMCCAIALSLSLTHTFIHTQTKPTHTLSLNMRIQNYLLNNNNNNKKWPLVSYILVSNKRKRKKHCADWYITDTDQASPICHAHIHTHSQKYSLLDLTPICLIFFVVFVITFFRQVQIFKFFLESIFQ